MKYKAPPEINIPYLIAIASFTIILPALSTIVEYLVKMHLPLSLSVPGKWFIFWAVGARSFIDGGRQVISPGFTADEIFHIFNPKSRAIIRELGIANICAGIVGLLSLFLPSWRIVSAFASGLFCGLVAILRAFTKPAGINDWIALISDVFVFICLACYVIFSF